MGRRSHRGLPITSVLPGEAIVHILSFLTPKQRWAGRRAPRRGEQSGCMHIMHAVLQPLAFPNDCPTSCTH